MRSVVRPVVVGLAVAGLSVFGAASAQADGGPMQPTVNTSPSWHKDNSITSPGWNNDTVNAAVDKSFNTTIVFEEMDLD